MLASLSSQVPNAKLRLLLHSALEFLNPALHGEKPSQMALVLFRDPDNFISKFCFLANLIKCTLLPYCWSLLQKEKKAFGGRVSTRSENETAKERKKTQQRLTVMVTSLFAWPMTGAENYGHNSCHLLPSSFSLRLLEKLGDLQ